MDNAILRLSKAFGHVGYKIMAQNPWKICIKVVGIHSVDASMLCHGHS